jgi:hypothetical protein
VLRRPTDWPRGRACGNENPLQPPAGRRTAKARRRTLHPPPPPARLSGRNPIRRQDAGAPGNPPRPLGGYNPSSIFHLPSSISDLRSPIFDPRGSERRSPFDSAGWARHLVGPCDSLR